MGIREKENRRKSVVESMVGNIGSNKKTREDKGERKQKGFRLSVEVAKALAIRSAMTGEDQEVIVERLLREYLKEDIENIDS